MGQCARCHRKAKRSCLLPEISSICSICCGQVRRENTCYACVYYHPPVRKYQKIPAYTPAKMDASFELQDISDVFESAICTYDAACSCQLKDPTAIRMIELLLDYYYFQDEIPRETDETVLQGFKAVIDSAEQNLTAAAREEIVKVLGAIYFVAVRRTRGGREYLDIIRRYVGVETGGGRLRIWDAGLSH